MYVWVFLFDFHFTDFALKKKKKMVNPEIQIDTNENTLTKDYFLY